jgi:hypothetical protein
MAVPEFRTLIQESGGNHMKYVAFMYDHESPYRNMPEPERKKRIQKDIFGTSRIKDDRFLKEAVRVYRELQYDPLIEQYDIFMEKVTEFNQMLRNTKMDIENVDTIQKAMIANKKVSETALELRKMVRESMAAKDGKIRGGGSKSFLESNLPSIHNEMDMETYNKLKADAEPKKKGRN